jgi:hypothetical protein
MKSSILITCAIAAIALFELGSKKIDKKTKADVETKSNESRVKAVYQQNAVVQKTLNGIDSIDAMRMKTNFKSNKGFDKKPAKESIWFPKKTIINMVSLLDEERKAEKLDRCTKGVTDGIRIHFVNDGSYSHRKMNNSIILVSTKYYAPNDKAPSGANHIDYYKHAANAGLFSETKDDLRGRISKMNAIDIFNPKDLYNIYNVFFRVFPQKDTCIGSHYLSRSQANKMVNQFGRNSIKTTSEWFDLDVFRKIANETKSDGLRIYFARHPKSFRKKDDPDKYKEAFVLVTTVPLIIGRDTFHKDNYICLAIEDNICRTKNIARVSEGGGDDKGELCPDACNPGDSLSTLNQKKRPLLKKHN